MRQGLLWLSERQGVFNFVRRNGLARRFASRFVAGESIDQGVEAARELSRRGITASLDLLGESVSAEAEAVAARDQYLRMLDSMAASGAEVNVSVKLTQMGLDIDPGFCRQNVRRIVDRAREIGAFVRIDMEDHTRTDLTLDIARALHAEYADAGVVIQSYLRRSADDIAALNADQIRVRLCKGAYNEPATVAFSTKAEVDESFAQLAEQLLLDGRYPGIATHDEQLIVRTINFAQAHGIGPERFEFQMLYGIRRDLQQLLVGQGWTVRVYVPYGVEWYPYFMRRLAERPANILFILRSLLREGRG